MNFGEKGDDLQRSTTKYKETGKHVGKHKPDIASMENMILITRTITA